MGFDVPLRADGLKSARWLHVSFLSEHLLGTWRLTREPLGDGVAQSDARRSDAGKALEYEGVCGMFLPVARLGMGLRLAARVSGKGRRSCVASDNRRVQA